MKFFLWCIAIIIILRMISNFLRPLLGFNAANERLRQMQEQMKEMNNKMNETANRRTTNKIKEGDYIDYEEVK